MKWPKFLQIKSVILYGVVVALSACSSDETQTAKEPALSMEASVDQFFNHYNNLTLANGVPKISEDEAYKWADKFVEKLIPLHGEPIGFKGAFFEGKFKEIGLSRPASGIILSKGMYDSGVTVKLSNFNTGFVDSDFLALIKDEKINDAQTDLEILASLEGVIPFIELIDAVVKPESRNIGSVLITNLGWRAGVKGKLIPVDATEEWVKRLQNFTYMLNDGKGKLYASRSIKETYDPLNNIRMLRDSLHLRGKRLKKGDLLSLGNIGFMFPLKFMSETPDRIFFVGDTAILTYKNLDPKGSVQVVVHFDRTD